MIVFDPAGKTNITGNAGSAEVTVSLDGFDDGISLIEVTPGGNVMITVVDSKGTSIHSRHTLIQHEAQAFLACLTELRESEPDCRVGETAYRYWTEAIGE